MRIHDIQVDVTTCVDVEVSIEDVIAELPLAARQEWLTIFLNRYAGFLNSVTDEMIAGLNDKQCKTVRDFFLLQAERYLRFPGKESHASQEA